MRRNIVTVYEGDFKFIVELDTGSSPDTKFKCWVYNKNGTILYRKDKTSQVRKYFKEFNSQHINNFCRKFAYNEKYRNSYL